MSLLKTIFEAQNGAALKQLADKFNMKPDQAGQAVGQLMPALTGAMKRNMVTPDGLQGLVKALQSGSHQKYVEQPETLTNEETIKDGNGILGHLLGSKDVSRQVAAQASANTGIDVNILKKMLPMVAAMTMGGMSKQAKGGGLLDSLGDSGKSAGGLLGGAMAAFGGGKADVGGMLGKMLDSDGDGSVMDDLMGFAKKLM